MRKLLKPKDILFLTLAHAGDLFEEAKDPLHLVSSAYKNMYGFIPDRYKKHNFFQVVSRTLRTGDIEKVVKNGKIYLRLTSVGKSKTKRDFPITNFTKSWSRRWVIVIFDISEKSKSIRNNFRGKLRSLGFGMLQESVWISPLSIGQDMREFVNSIGLSEHVFVMEISGFVLGDPKQLVRNIWHLDQLEKDYLHFETNIKTLNQLIKNESDRIDINEAKRVKDAGNRDYRNKKKENLNRDNINKDKVDKDNINKDYVNELLKKKREAMKNNLEFLVNFPPLPRELLPGSLQNVFPRNKT